MLPSSNPQVKVYLPRVQAGHDLPEVKRAPALVSHGTETILLVEDEDLVRVLAKKILQHHGYSILEARDGMEALTTASQHAGKIHPLITDVMMPRMSGYREVLLRRSPSSFVRLHLDVQDM